MLHHSVIKIIIILIIIIIISHSILMANSCRTYTVIFTAVVS